MNELEESQLLLTEREKIEQQQKLKNTENKKKIGYEDVYIYTSWYAGVENPQKRFQCFQA